MPPRPCCAVDNGLRASPLHGVKSIDYNTFSWNRTTGVGHISSQSPASDGCRWLNYEEIRSAIVERHQWLMFVGDSDTRFFVFELLQILAAATYSPKVAARYPGLWLGGRPFPMPDDGDVEWFAEASKQVADTKNDWMKRCVIDFVYDRRGTLIYNHTAHCKDASPVNSSEYVSLGQNYHIDSDNSASFGPGALRVTFVGTSSFKQTAHTFGGVAETLTSSRTKPTLLWVGAGAWFGLEQPSPEEEERRVSAFVEQLFALSTLAPAPTVHVYATTLGQLNRNYSFSQYVRLQLRRAAVRSLPHESWMVFDRTFRSLVQHNVTRYGSALRMASGHAPPIVNFVDWQRFLALLASKDEVDGPKQRCDFVADSTKISSRGQGSILKYGPWCAGIAAGRQVFAEAMYHFCDVDIVSE
jgi:hypothetical protein